MWLRHLFQFEPASQDTSLPFTDTVCGLMSALCANASGSHLLPHYSSNVIHKGAQVTLGDVTHGISVSITSYLMYLFPITVLLPYLLIWTIFPLFRSPTCWKYASYARPWPLQPPGCLYSDVYALHMWSEPSPPLPRPLLFSICTPPADSFPCLHAFRTVIRLAYFFSVQYAKHIDQCFVTICSQNIK